MDEFIDSSSLTGRCPYCNAEEIVDEFPSASQRFSVYKFMCGTELAFVSADEGLVIKRCKKETLNAISRT